MIKTLYYKNNYLYILDQRLLPFKKRYIVCKNYKQVYKCIKDMAIRGAPAIGDAAAYGMVLACQIKFHNISHMKKYLTNAGRVISSARPTAVNLVWAIERMNKVVHGFKGSCTNALKRKVLREASKIYKEDIYSNKKIGNYGAKLLKKKSVILTHCNAGSLATAGWGTATGVIYTANRQGKIKKVFVDETRPYLQGARLTAYELKEMKVPFELICDNMAGHFMKNENINAVIVGADRIAGNGDVANKIGTYSLAVLAKEHNIPFYVAAPFSTIDVKTSCGKEIPIEERSTDEVVMIKNIRIAPRGIKARHPAFDITPSRLITAIITDKGVIKKPFNRRIRKKEVVQKRLHI